MRNPSKNTIKRGNKIIAESKNPLLRGIWKMTIFRVPQNNSPSEAIKTALYARQCLIDFTTIISQPNEPI